MTPEEIEHHYKEYNYLNDRAQYWYKLRGKIPNAGRKFYIYRAKATELNLNFKVRSEEDARRTKAEFKQGRDPSK